MPEKGTKAVFSSVIPRLDISAPPKSCERQKFPGPAETTGGGVREIHLLTNLPGDRSPLKLVLKEYPLQIYISLLLKIMELSRMARMTS